MNTFAKFVFIYVKIINTFRGSIYGTVQLSDCIMVKSLGLAHGIPYSFRFESRLGFWLFFIIPIGFISRTTPRKTRQKKLLSNFVAIKINMAYGNGPQRAQ